MRIAIVGGGATGLTAGYELSKEGHSVAIFESGHIGGMACGMPFENTRLEPLYHHVFPHDAQIISLLDELGLMESLIWEKVQNGIYINGKMYPFSKPIDLLLFPELSIPDRIRLGMAVLRAIGEKDHIRMESQSAREWLTQRTGRSSYETLWRPLLRAKFDEDADHVSAVWIWNKFKLRGSARSGIGAERLGYLRGSFQVLYDALIDRIRSFGGTVRSQEVLALAPGEKDTVAVTTVAGADIFDKVVFTGAPSQLQQIGAFSKEYADRLNRQKYKANLCVKIILERLLSDYYWLTIADEKAPFVVYVEHTNMIKDAGYNGKHVVYLSRYLDVKDPFWSLSDQEVTDAFFAYLKTLFPVFSLDHVAETTVHRVEYAQPVIYQHYSQRIQPFQTPIKNLYLACMAQIYPEDRGQNYALCKGKEIAEALLRDIKGGL